MTILAKVGAWDGLLDSRFRNMQGLTTLPLAGGQRGDDAADRPDGQEHSLTFVKSIPEDEAPSTGHEVMFDDVI